MLHRILHQPWLRMAALLAVAGVGVVSVAQAQTTPDTPADTPSANGASGQTAAPTATPVSDKLILREGTEVNLKFSNEISSKTAHEDDPVELALAEDLTIGNVVVAKAGSVATAIVTHAKRAGMMGKGGELNIRLEHMKAGNIKVKLRGSKGREGEDKTGTAVALTVLFGPIGLIKHGKEIDIKPGTPITVYVDEDTPMTSVQ